MSARTGSGSCSISAADLAPPRLVDPLDHGQGKVFLVLELVIERTARVSGLARHLLEHEVAVAVAREPPRGRLEQGAARPCTPLGLGCPRGRGASITYIHVCMLLYACSATARVQHRVNRGLTMRLPNTAHTSRPWRIHELTRDFRLEDVWALPTPGGPDDFPRLVQMMASFDPSQSSSGAVRTLFAIRWKLGELLGWDGPDVGHRLGAADAPRPVAGGSARRSVRPGLRRAPLHLAVPDRRRVGGGDRQPDRSRGHAHWLGPGRRRAATAARWPCT